MILQFVTNMIIIDSNIFLFCGNDKMCDNEIYKDILEKLSMLFHTVFLPAYSFFFFGI